MNTDTQARAAEPLILEDSFGIIAGELPNQPAAMLEAQAPAPLSATAEEEKMIFYNNHWFFESEFEPEELTEIKKEIGEQAPSATAAPHGEVPEETYKMRYGAMKVIMEDQVKTIKVLRNACEQLSAELTQAKERLKQAEAFIAASPCDPDITPEQQAAYQIWQEGKAKGGK